MLDILKTNDATSWQEKVSQHRVMEGKVRLDLPRHNTNQTESEFGMCDSMSIRKIRKEPTLKYGNSVFADVNLCTGVYKFI